MDLTKLLGECPSTIVDGGFTLNDIFTDAIVSPKLVGRNPHIVIQALTDTVFSVYKLKNDLQGDSNSLAFTLAAGQFVFGVSTETTTTSGKVQVFLL